jgi:hypothetical protein
VGGGFLKRGFRKQKRPPPFGASAILHVEFPDLFPLAIIKRKLCPLTVPGEPTFSASGRHER